MKKTHKDKTIWIIGASSGIGAALAKELAAEEANLILSARRKNTLNDLLNQLPGRNHQCIPLDITDQNQLHNAIQHIKENHTQLDSIIFMAGIYEPLSIEKITPELATQILNTNFLGAVRLIHTISPWIKQQPSPVKQMAFCASIAGYRGLPLGQPYCASKAALINFTESLHLELTNTDIKLICPGFVKTPLTDKNPFKMPYIIEPQEAAKYIKKGLLSKKFEIHFPKKISMFFKLLRMAPHRAYFYLIQKLTKQ